MTKCTDLTGKRFGRLLVVGKAEYIIYPNGKKASRWICKCSCGKEKTIRQNDLCSGRTTSCGCYHSDKLSEMNKSLKKYDRFDKRVYGIWTNMIRRCYSKKSGRYNNYGARGIKVCDEWRNDFLSFYDWSMNNGYNKNLTIDRIDTNGNYCPDNCKWSTIKEQCNNKTNNIRITYLGKTQTLTQWCDELGLKYSRIRERIMKLNWSPIDALTKL